MQNVANIHGTDGGSVTEALPEPEAYAARWIDIIATVSDKRILAAMWDGEAELRKQIRQQYRHELSLRGES